MAVRIPPGVPPGASFVFEIPEGRPPPMGIPVSVGGGGAGQMTVGTTLPPAKKFAECPISYEPLCNAPVGVFVDSRGARVSGHYYSLAAAQEWLASGNGMCPMTRRPVASVMAIPDVRTDPEGWFSAAGNANAVWNFCKSSGSDGNVVLRNTAGDVISSPLPFSHTRDAHATTDSRLATRDDTHDALADS